MDLGLRQNWWAMVVRGVVAILFGLLAFAWPGLTLYVLVVFFGAYALVDGIFAILAAVTGHEEAGRWWALLLHGIISVGAGLVTFFWPGITAMALLFVIAFWAIVTGVLQIVTAIRLREYIEGEWALAVAGILSIVFGVLTLITPGAGALAILWLIASYAIALGILQIIHGFQLRGGRGFAAWPPTSPFDRDQPTGAA